MAAVGLVPNSSSLQNSSSPMSPLGSRVFEIIELSDDDEEHDHEHNNSSRSRQRLIPPSSHQLKNRREAPVIDLDLTNGRHPRDGRNPGAYDDHHRASKRRKLHGEPSEDCKRGLHPSDPSNPSSNHPLVKTPNPPKAVLGSSVAAREHCSVSPFVPAPAIDPSEPPYYYDSKLEAQMYRGKGYERFPVVLGTVNGHQEICRKWEERPLRRRHRNHKHVDPEKPEPIEDDSDVELSYAHMKCLQQVLEVLPDIQHDFALRSVRTYAVEPHVAVDLQDHLLSAHVISRILEQGEYPKAKPSRAYETEEMPLEDNTGTTIEYDKSVPKDPAYLKDAVKLLAAVFEHVPTKYMYGVVLEKRSVFNAYLWLRECENNYYTHASRPYPRHRNPRKSLEKKYLHRNASEQRNQDNYLQMVNELQAAKQYATREDIKQAKHKQKEEEEIANLEAHRLAGALIQCCCCFDDEVPMNRTVSCEGDEVHFYCYGCIAGQADTQIGMMRYEMKCMDTNGCTADLLTEEIARAIPLKTFDRLALNKQQAEISAAGIEGLEQCPFCEFKAICEPIEFDCIFNCQNPDCGRATCRRCKEDAHIPKTCEENRNDRGLSARHFVEEARTDAVTRPCPKCGVKIIKEMGCNKMMCTQCRTLICYVCKSDISDNREGGYHHFNRPGATCKLHDQVGVDRHEQEADEAEKEAIKEAKAKNADLDERELQIETGTKREERKHKAPPQPLLHQWHIPQNDGLHFIQDIQNPHPLADAQATAAHMPFMDPRNRNLEHQAYRPWHEEALPQRRNVPQLPAFQPNYAQTYNANGNILPFGVLQEEFAAANWDFHAGRSQPPDPDLFGYGRNQQVQEPQNMAAIQQYATRAYPRQQVDEWLRGVPRMDFYN